MVAGWAAQMCLSVSCSADWTVGTAGVVVKKKKKSPPSFDGSQGCSGAAPKSLTTDACKWAHGPTPPSAQEDEIDHSEKKKKRTAKHILYDGCTLKQKLQLKEGKENHQSDDRWIFSQGLVSNRGLLWDTVVDYIKHMQYYQWLDECPW